MAALSEWLQIMLGEIARKREELERGHEEQLKREAEKTPAPAAGPPAQLPRASQQR